MHRRAMAAVIASLLVSGAVAGPARADRLSDARAEAERVADRIEALGDEAALLGEQYNGARLELAAAEQAVRDAEADLAHAETSLGQTRDAMADFALRAYVLADQTVGIVGLVAGGSLAEGIAQRSTYSELALGASLEDASQLKQLSQDLTAKQSTLEARRTDLDAEVRATEAARQAAQAAQADQEDELRRVEGEVATLVEQERQRREEEARLAAEEAVRQAQLAAQTEAQARAVSAAAATAARQAEAEAVARQAEASALPASTAPTRPPTSPGTRTPLAGLPAAPSPGSTDPTAVPPDEPAADDPPATDGTSDAAATDPPSADPPARATPEEEPAPETAAPASSAGAIAVQAALSQLGVPYRFATARPGVVFDCSGLTKWAWAQAGVSMEHYSYSQARQFPSVSVSDLQPGDLVFPGSLGHVGIYIGSNRYVHAPRPGDVVKVTVMNASRIVHAVRPR